MRKTISSKRLMDELLQLEMLLQFKPKDSRLKRQALYNESMHHTTNNRRLGDVYGRYSYNKVRAFDYCEDLKYDLQGYDLKIISHNTFMFTVGFYFKALNNLYYMYITPSYNTAVLIESEVA